MERLDKTHKVGIFLGALLVATLILKWKLVYFIRPHDYTTTSLIGSSLVGIFIIGSSGRGNRSFYQKNMGMLCILFCSDWCNIYWNISHSIAFKVDPRGIRPDLSGHYVKFNFYHCNRDNPYKLAQDKGANGAFREQVNEHLAQKASQFFVYSKLSPLGSINCSLKPSWAFCARLFWTFGQVDKEKSKIGHNKTMAKKIRELIQDLVEAGFCEIKRDR